MGEEWVIVRSRYRNTAAGHRCPGRATSRTVRSQPLFPATPLPATPPAIMPAGIPVPDPGIGQLAMLRVAAHRLAATAPGPGEPAWAGLPRPPPVGGAAACRR